MPGRTSFHLRLPDFLAFLPGGWKSVELLISAGGGHSSRFYLLCRVELITRRLIRLTGGMLTGPSIFNLLHISLDSCVVTTINWRCVVSWLGGKSIEELGVILETVVYPLFSFALLISTYLNVLPRCLFFFTTHMGVSLISHILLKHIPLAANSL